MHALFFFQISHIKPNVLTQKLIYQDKLHTSRGWKGKQSHGLQKVTNQPKDTKMELSK